MRELSDLYREMAELTHAVCKTCDPPFACCELAGCEQARFWAKEVYGAYLGEAPDGRLPYLGPYGCIVAPHFRFLCTLWLCKDAVEPPGYNELKLEIVRQEVERWKTKSRFGLRPI